MRLFFLLAEPPTAGGQDTEAIPGTGEDFIFGSQVQFPTVAVDKNCGDSQCRGDGAGVLGAGTAEGGQHMLLDVEAAHDRDLPDGAYHGFVGHPDESHGHVFDGHGLVAIAPGVIVDGPRQVLHRGPGGLKVQGLVFGGAENMGKIVGLEAAEDQIRVGDGQLTVFAVAYRTRVGTGCRSLSLKVVMA